MAEQNGQNIHQGHRLRLKRRFHTEGLQHFEEHTALELLLFFAVPRQDTNPIAHRLLNRFGSLSGVFSASMRELTEVDGVGENTATLLRLVPELMNFCREKEQEAPTFHNPLSMGEYLARRLCDQKTETMLMLCLDGKNRAICCEKLGSGTVGSITTTVREVAQRCLRNNVSAVVLAHNHPSGLALPSREDIVMTRKLQDFLREIGVQLRDHLVITEREFYSMKDHKLF